MIETLQRAKGKTIEFVSAKNGKMEAHLIDFNKEHIQVRLLHDLRANTRTWYKNETRLFDLDKISDVVIAPDKITAPKLSPYLEEKRKVEAMKERNKQGHYPDILKEAKKRLKTIKEKPAT